MPNIFKALASIGAWVLFLMGLSSFVMAFVFWFGSPIDPSTAGVWCAGDSAAVMGTVMVTLSVCIMVLRKKME
ncbi:hypothetical protein ACFLV0_07265 [Chloroflexota bacterium]